MKKTTRSAFIFAACLMAVMTQTVRAQEKNKTATGLKNTIHFNITNPIIFAGKSYVIGYERVVSKHQSFTVNFGTTGFPSLNIINSDSIQLKTIRDKKGYNFSVDYRFYLAKENKYPAPHGLYIGPYYSYNYFQNKHSWQIKGTNGVSSQVNSELSLSIHTVGFELGYQFILWNRVTLDMVLVGPGVAGYNLKALLGANLSAEDKQKLLDKLDEALSNKFPGYSFVIDDGSFKKTGAEKTTSFGYRYMIQIGFRF